MKFSFSPRPGVTFPNFWFSLNECSDNNHYFWTKVTCHHICVLLQLNFLLFLRKFLEMMALQNPILEAGKTSSCTNDWLSRNDMVLLYLPLPLRLSMTSCWVLEAQTSWSFIWKNTYIITWCKTLIRATFQSIRKTRIWWSQDFFLPNLTTRWLVCKQSPNIG